MENTLNLDDLEVIEASDLQVGSQFHAFKFNAEDK